MELFSFSNLGTLLMLIALQAVLGFDNLLYISLESKRAPESRRSFVRRTGIILAVGLRILLLFGLIHLTRYVTQPLLTIDVPKAIEGTFNLHSLIVLFGGAFIVYTAIREIWHMMGSTHDTEEAKPSRSERSVILMIVAMNLVFSFDSILSAMALTDVFLIMALAIVIGGLLMVWLAERVSTFLERNRLYEVLGLFILFVVGIMLLTEGGEMAHLHLVGNPVEKMSKTTFYFVIAILVLTDVVQGRYQRKLLDQQKTKEDH